MTLVKLHGNGYVKFVWKTKQATEKKWNFNIPNF